MFKVHIEGFTIEGESWIQPDFTPRYAAQLKCPKCDTFYTSEGKRTAIAAQSNVKSSMRRHIKKKHKRENL